MSESEAKASKAATLNKITMSLRFFMPKQVMESSLGELVNGYKKIKSKNDIPGASKKAAVLGLFSQKRA